MDRLSRIWISRVCTIICIIRNMEGMHRSKLRVCQIYARKCWIFLSRRFVFICLFNFFACTRAEFIRQPLALELGEFVAMNELHFSILCLCATWMFKINYMNHCVKFYVVGQMSFLSAFGKLYLLCY